MSAKEATARIKINKLLDAAGWRFFQDGNAPANIRLEPNVTIKTTRSYIEAEQVSPNPNRELIARYAKNIQSTLARVSDKDEPAMPET